MELNCLLHRFVLNQSPQAIPQLLTPHSTLITGSGYYRARFHFAPASPRGIPENSGFSSFPVDIFLFLIKYDETGAGISSSTGFVFVLIFCCCGFAPHQSLPCVRGGGSPTARRRGCQNTIPYDPSVKIGSEEPILPAPLAQGSHGCSRTSAYYPIRMQLARSTMRWGTMTRVVRRLGFSR